MLNLGVILIDRRSPVLIFESIDVDIPFSPIMPLVCRDGDGSRLDDLVDPPRINLATFDVACILCVVAEVDGSGNPVLLQHTKTFNCPFRTMNEIMKISIPCRKEAFICISALVIT